MIGDKGRRRSSGGGATVSDAYFDFLFLKGAINSKKRNVKLIKLNIIYYSYITFCRKGQMYTIFKCKFFTRSGGCAAAVTLV